MESTGQQKTSAKANKKPVQLENKQKQSLPAQTAAQTYDESGVSSSTAGASIDQQIMDKMALLSMDTSIVTSDDAQAPTQTKINELLARLPKVTEGKDSVQEKADALNDFFQNEVIALLRRIHETTIDNECTTQLCNTQQEEYVLRSQKATSVQKRYEVITREYTVQNKDFDKRHQEIALQEKEKREKISNDFQSHIATISKSLEDEMEALKCSEKFTEADPDDPEKLIGHEVEYENEVLMENAQLERKYKELLIEIKDKSEMMDKQLEDKNNGVLNIEETIDLQIKQQEDSINQNIEVYQKQAEIKKNEEAELIKIKKEYTSKYQEFEKHHKTAKQLAKMKTKSVVQLEEKVKSLEKQKEKEAAKYKSGGKKGSNSEASPEEQFKALEDKYSAQIAAASEKRDKLKEECARLQELINAKKQQNQ